ncbi:hypothetical protein GUITHDRAFT_151058 [Guillardia theta CCMP2712]|uniref:Uncharacterized protein n=1 Tax=Guillardia theta (strain CCMP2712) TaxID=905079 RepID=L1JQH6_GUITC|nr:hypothetical protein GUITHDRAFT_151058 [Guillardia theta CCMP2712]EKX50712.1 hypothetical protein GUITHDRAFT_151058 [Guillardia theta CCMP2712]|eukprot:XP_005837692.1 hypothetical protein GUITHDRAFT_151058 [Guillardia theta CCMP2712]
MRFEMLTVLRACNARLIAVGGMCPDNSDALYSKDWNPKYSRKELIEHGVWMTKKQLRKEKRAEEESVHHHFS